MNGSMMWTMPIVVPVKLCMSLRGASITPMSWSQLLTTPRRCSSTSQA